MSSYPIMLELAGLQTPMNFFRGISHRKIEVLKLELLKDRLKHLIKEVVFGIKTSHQKEIFREQCTAKKFACGVIRTIDKNLKKNLNIQQVKKNLKESLTILILS